MTPKLTTVTVPVVVTSTEVVLVDDTTTVRVLAKTVAGTVV